MSGPRRPEGPLVQFVVVAKRWVVRVGESRPALGACWVVDGEMCRVLAVQVLGPDRWRVYVEPDRAFQAEIPQYCGNALPSLPKR